MHTAKLPSREDVLIEPCWASTGDLGLLQLLKFLSLGILTFTYMLYTLFGPSPPFPHVTFLKKSSYYCICNSSLASNMMYVYFLSFAKMLDLVVRGSGHHGDP
jgi:hypothetical protein